MKLSTETRVFRVSSEGVNSKVEELKLHTANFSSNNHQNYAYFTEESEALELQRKRIGWGAINNLVWAMTVEQIDHVLKLVTEVAEKPEKPKKRS